MDPVTEPMPREVADLLRKGSAYVRDRRFHDAIDVLEHAYDLAPHERDVLRPLALAYMSTGNTREARKLARDVAAIMPNDAAAHNLKAEAYFIDGRFGDALHSAKRSTRLNPHDSEAWLLRANVHAELGEYKRASYAYGHVLRHTDSVEAFAGRAEARKQRGHLEDARHDMIHALAIDPKHPLALQVKQDLKRMGISKAQLQRTPGELAWDNLEQDYWAARRSLSPRRKADYLDFFNRDFSPQLTHEGAALERLAKYHTYMVMEVGQRLAFSIQYRLRPHVSHAPTRAALPVNYATEYVVADRILQNDSPMQAYLLLPVDRVYEQQAIIVFRGTSPRCWQDGIGKDMGVRTGLRADCDVDGVGFNEFQHYKNDISDWVSLALSKHVGVTFTGHSLGGAFADRSYLWARRNFPDARGMLRSVTYNAPALDRYTVSRSRPTAPEQVFKFISTGDVVHRGGEMHVPGTVLRYPGDKFSLRKLMQTHQKAHLSDSIFTRAVVVMGSVIGVEETGMRTEANHGAKFGRNWERFRRAIGAMMIS